MQVFENGWNIKFQILHKPEKWFFYFTTHFYLHWTLDWTANPILQVHKIHFCFYVHFCGGKKKKKKRDAHWAEVHRESCMMVAWLLPQLLGPVSVPEPHFGHFPIGGWANEEEVDEDPETQVPRCALGLEGQPKIHCSFLATGAVKYNSLKFPLWGSKVNSVNLELLVWGLSAKWRLKAVNMLYDNSLMVPRCGFDSILIGNWSANQRGRKLR